MTLKLFFPHSSTKRNCFNVFTSYSRDLTLIYWREDGNKMDTTKNKLGDDEMVETVKSLCPCRSVQIDQLIELFGDKDELSYPRIFLYGLTGSGKTHVLKSIMKTFMVRMNLVVFIT